MQLGKIMNKMQDKTPDLPGGPVVESVKSPPANESDMGSRSLV